MLLTLLAGCAALDSLLGIGTLDLDAEYDALTEPTVLQGWYVGIAPLADDINLDQTQWGSGALALVCAANAETADTIEDTPIDGGAVSVIGNQLGTVALQEVDDGAYSSDGGGGLRYIVGDEVIVAIDDGEKHTVAVATPDAPAVEIADKHVKGDSLVLDASGQGYDGLLVVVVDLQSGDVLFDNTPQDAIDILNFLNGDAATSVVVPGVVFSGDSVFAVGVAGLKVAPDEAYTGINTILSRMMTGRFRFHATTTLPV